MFSFFNRNESSAHSYGGNSNKYSLLRKVFPSIQMGRDIDLERYLQLRTSGKPVDKWKFHYDKLSHKYTSEERRLLIHVLRKYNNDFNRVFSIVIDKLYNRLIEAFKKKINLIISNIGNEKLNKIITESEKKNLVLKINKCLDFCSMNHAQAYNDILLLEYFSGNIDYKQQEFTGCAELIKLYLNGILFAEKQEYKFNMNEEKRKQTGKAPSSTPQPVSLRLYISKKDISQMIVDREKDEYDQAFAFYEKYFTRLRDMEFANKLFLYSRTYKTEHFKIFEIMRRGLVNHFRKERIFDDVFKVVCSGRYIYDIKKEKRIQNRMWLFSKLVNKEKRKQQIAERKKKLISSPVKSTPAETKPYKSPKVSLKTNVPVKPVESLKTNIPAKQAEFFKPGIPEKPVETHKPDKTIRKKEKASKPPVMSIKNPTLSITGSINKKKNISDMIAEIVENSRDKRVLVDEFKNRLSGYILKYFKDLPDVDLERENDLKQFKEFLRYILRNYDRIVVDDENQKVYDKEMKEFGFNINLFYTVVFECFMDLKSDYLLNNIKSKSGPGILSRLSGFFKKKK